MDRDWAIVLGMSVAYLASFLGMGFAWWSYRRRKKGTQQDREKS
ncbi:MAG: hypothetical protein AB1898_10535 [Acidobacteriota bacterium]